MRTSRQEIIQFPEIDLSTLSYSMIFDQKKILKFQEILYNSTGIISTITELTGIPSEENQEDSFAGTSAQGETLSEPVSKFDFKEHFCNPFLPIAYTCLENRLLKADIYMTISDRPVAIWTISQNTNTEHVDQSKINFNLETNVIDNTRSVIGFPQMSLHQFQNVAQLVYEYVNELSEKKYTNLLLKAEISENEKAIEIKLKKDDQYREIVETSLEGIVSLDSHGYILYVNQRMCLMLGYSKEEILGRSFEDFLIRDNYNNIEEKMNSNMKKDDVIFERCFLRKNGKILWAQVSANARFDHNEKYIGSFAMLNDITSRKEAEAALVKSKANLASVIENSLYDVWAINTNYEIIYINSIFEKSFFNAFGVHLKIGMNILSSMPEPLQNLWKSRYDRALQNESFGFEDRVDLGYIVLMFEVTMNPIVSDGKVIGASFFSRDITQRKNAEDELSRSEARFKALVENAPEAIVLLDFKTGKYISFNENACKLYKMSREQLCKVGPIELSPPFQPNGRASSEMAMEMLNLAKAGESPRFEWVHRNALGEDIPCEINLTSLPSTRGTLIRGSIVDITERKKTEQALIQSRDELKRNEQRLSFALTATTDAIWELDYTTGKTIYSKRWFEMLGYNDSELEMSFDAWRDICHPDDYQPTLDKMAAVLNNPESAGYNAEFRMRHKDGSWKWILGRGNVVIRDEHLNPLLLSGTNTDITERKKSEILLLENEEKLNTLFNSMQEMVVLHEVVFNDEGQVVNYRIIDCNTAFTKTTGIKKEDAIGKLATEVYQQETPPYLHEFTQVGITGIAYEYTTYYAPMDKHFFISVVSPKRNTFATITNDITAIIQIQEVIRSKNKELENYLYVASHDLRSPLVNIQGFSQRLQKQINNINHLLSSCQLETEIREGIEQTITTGIPKTLDFIYSNVIKMDGLINGLLKLSRTGRIIMDIQKVDMNELIQTILSNHNFQIVEASAQVKVNTLVDCYGDYRQLNQLFSNLIENAIKYSDGKKQLIIQIAAHSQFNKVIYSVKDSGIGIAERHLSKIWDVFYRANPDAFQTGEGLGLSLARRIVEKHHGKIWVESQEGIGSTFYVELQKNNFEE